MPTWLLILLIVGVSLPIIIGAFILINCQRRKRRDERRKASARRDSSSSYNQLSPSYQLQNSPILGGFVPPLPSPPPTSPASLHLLVPGYHPSLHTLTNTDLSGGSPTTPIFQHPPPVVTTTPQPQTPRERESLRVRSARRKQEQRRLDRLRNQTQASVDPVPNNTPAPPSPAQQLSRQDRYKVPSVDLFGSEATTEELFSTPRSSVATGTTAKLYRNEFGFPAIPTATDQEAAPHPNTHARENNEHPFTLQLDPVQEKDMYCSTEEYIRAKSPASTEEFVLLDNNVKRPSPVPSRSFTKVQGAADEMHPHQPSSEPTYAPMSTSVAVPSSLEMAVATHSDLFNFDHTNTQDKLITTTPYPVMSQTTSANDGGLYDCGFGEYWGGLQQVPSPVVGATLDYAQTANPTHPNLNLSGYGSGDITDTKHNHAFPVTTTTAGSNRQISSTSDADAQLASNRTFSDERPCLNTPISTTDNSTSSTSLDSEYTPRQQVTVVGDAYRSCTLIRTPRGPVRPAVVPPLNLSLYTPPSTVIKK